MKYHHLEPAPSTLDQRYVGLGLQLKDLKILYNTCVDVLDRNPEMISYGIIMVKLGMIIDTEIENHNATLQEK